jgi:hypothetical protein
MISVDFVKTRALATRSTQASIATSWSWSKKTLAQWDADIAAIEQLITAESTAWVEWRNAAEVWQSDVDRIQDITRQVASLGLVQFRDNPVTLKLFETLRTDGKSRADIYAQGLAARAVWEKADEDWQITPSLTLTDFGELLDSCSACQKAEVPALTAWRKSSVDLNIKAEAVDRDNVAWYTEATRRFAAGTVEGNLIRSNVPTTSRPESPVGQAVISNLMVSGGDIHFDCAAAGATRYTFLQQAPGLPAFVVILADTAQTHVTLHGQVAGLHRFKAFGSNSRGQGADSAVVQVTVPASAAA